MNGERGTTADRKAPVHVARRHRTLASGRARRRAQAAGRCAARKNIFFASQLVRRDARAWRAGARRARGDAEKHRPAPPKPYVGRIADAGRARAICQAGRATWESEFRCYIKIEQRTKKARTKTIGHRGRKLEEVAMRVYGQSLDTAKPTDPGALRGRFAATRPVTHGAERRAGAGEVADVINLPDHIADHSREQWLARFSNLSQLELAYDDHDKILWCSWNISGRPIFTLQLWREIRTLQRGVQQLFHDQPAGAQAPMRYIVWSSKFPGVYSLGGDLELFVELIRKRDREQLLDYATTCVDIVHLNAISCDAPVITV